MRQSLICKVFPSCCHVGALKAKKAKNKSKTLLNEVVLTTKISKAQVYKKDGIIDEQWHVISNKIQRYPEK